MLEAQFPWLTTLIVFPLIASLLVPVIPDKKGKSLRWYAVGVGIADFVLMCYAFGKTMTLATLAYKWQKVMLGYPSWVLAGQFRLMVFPCP